MKKLIKKLLGMEKKYKPATKYKLKDVVKVCSERVRGREWVGEVTLIERLFECDVYTLRLENGTSAGKFFDYELMPVDVDDVDKL